MIYNSRENRVLISLTLFFVAILCIYKYTIFSIHITLIAYILYPDSILKLKKRLRRKRYGYRYSNYYTPSIFENKFYSKNNEQQKCDCMENNSDEINRESQLIYDDIMRQNDNTRRFMEWSMQSVTSFDMGGYMNQPEVNPSETIAYDNQQDEINRENEMNQKIMDNMNEDNYMNTEINSDFNNSIDNNMNGDLYNDMSNNFSDMNDSDNNFNAFNNDINNGF